MIGEGKITAPPVPVSEFKCQPASLTHCFKGSSDRECLSAHSEVLALQQWLGISYKDAAHRLYIAELERMKSEEKTFKAFNNLQASTEKSLALLYKSVNEIESTLTTGSRERGPDVESSPEGSS